VLWYWQDFGEGGGHQLAGVDVGTSRETFRWSGSWHRWGTAGWRTCGSPLWCRGGSGGCPWGRSLPRGASEARPAWAGSAYAGSSSPPETWGRCGCPLAPTRHAGGCPLGCFDSTTFSTDVERGPTPRVSTFKIFLAFWNLIRALGAWLSQLWRIPRGPVPSILEVLGFFDCRGHSAGRYLLALREILKLMASNVNYFKNTIDRDLSNNRLWLIEGKMIRSLTQSIVVSNLYDNFGMWKAKSKEKVTSILFWFWWIFNFLTSFYVIFFRFFQGFSEYSINSKTVDRSWSIKYNQSFDRHHYKMQLTNWYPLDSIFWIPMLHIIVWYEN